MESALVLKMGHFLAEPGRLPIDALLTHRLRLSDLNAGFDRSARGECLRQVVEFERAN